MMPRISPFQASNAEEVAALIDRAIRQIDSSIYSPEVLAWWASQYTPEALRRLSTNREIFVAVHQEVAVGTVSLEGGTVYALFVDPRFARRGVATVLMQHVESLARDRGVRVLMVPASLTAKLFYAGRGYSIEPSDTSDGIVTTILMSRRLA
jgi:GNAT superfamily N-acetyltransferase